MCMMPNQTDKSEQLLLEQLRHGSEEAFREIFELHWQRVYAIAKSKLQSHDEAEEVTQGIFSTLWEKRSTLLITNLPYYLNVAVKNRVINLIRSRITQERYWDYYKRFIPLHQEDTRHTVEFDDLHEAVEAAIKHLPPKSREVFKLSRMEGRSNAEIARLLQLSEKAIEYHLTKSLKELRVFLRDFIAILVAILSL